MGTIQSGINSAMATVMGGVIGAKHIQGQQAVLDEAKALELGQIENAMTEAELVAKGVPQEEAQQFNIANTLGLQVGPEYKPRYDELQRMKSEGVLQSETYAKLQQDTMLRKRFTDLISTQSGRQLLNETLTKRDGGKK